MELKSESFKKWLGLSALTVSSILSLFAGIAVISFLVGCAPQSITNPRSSNPTIDTAPTGSTTTGNPVVASKLIVTSSSEDSTNQMESSTASASSKGFDSSWAYRHGHPARFFMQSIAKLLLPLAHALPSVSLVDALGLRVALTEATIALENIEIKVNEAQSHDEIEGSEVSYRGPYVIDLLDPSPESIDSAPLISQTYKRIQMKLASLDDSVQKMELVDSMAQDPAKKKRPKTAGFELRGSVGGAEFSVLLKAGSKLKITGPKGVRPDASEPLLLVFRLGEMLNKIDLSAVRAGQEISHTDPVPASSPCPEIDDNAKNLYTCFLSGLTSSGRFGRDKNGNRALDPTDDLVSE